MHWSPEQIANGNEKVICVPSTYTNYRIIHRKQIKQIAMKHLKRKDHFKRPAEKRGKFNDGGRTIKNVLKKYTNVKD